VAQHDESAREYDAQSRQYEWHGPEVLFGLAFEYVSAGETLLDMGIGTGLSALPFSKAGLSIVGIDASSDMLDVCRSKNAAWELKKHDILVTPLPCPEGGFDHVIACGVFHLIEKLDPLVAEASRVLKEKGTFVFTFEKHRVGADDAFRFAREKCRSGWMRIPPRRFSATARATSNVFSVRTGSLS